MPGQSLLQVACPLPPALYCICPFTCILHSLLPCLFPFQVRDSLGRLVELPIDTHPGHYRRETATIHSSAIVRLASHLRKFPPGACWGGAVCGQLLHLRCAC